MPFEWIDQWANTKKLAQMVKQQVAPLQAGIVYSIKKILILSSIKQFLILIFIYLVFIIPISLIFYLMT